MSEKSIDELYKLQEMIYYQNKELLYSEIYHDTIKGSDWLPADFSMSPGNMAFGYPALYLLYRILNEIRPQSILEMGLGQSTKMISKYIQKNLACTHQVVEHDKEWIDFFSTHYEMPETSHIVECPIKDITLDIDGNAINVTSYIGFAERFENEKYDFICIDGPYGFRSPVYSRIDILSIIPECLSESFVILLDDCHRTGEINTLKMISDTLREHGIDNASMVYRGEKGTGIVVSRNLEFLCTM